MVSSVAALCNAALWHSALGAKVKRQSKCQICNQSGTMISIPTQVSMQQPPLRSPPLATALRSSDRHIDNSLMHSDPGALIRALKQPRRSLAAAAAAARASSPASEMTTEQQQQQQQQPDGEAGGQQQQHQQQQYVASAGMDTVDAEQPAAAAAVVEDSRLPMSAAAAVFGPAAAAAAGNDEQHQQQQQQQQELHGALRPIETNGQGRKRIAAAADLAQGERPNKQQATTIASADGHVDAAAAAVKRLGHQADSHLDVQADPAAADSAAAADMAVQPKAADVARAAVLLRRLVSATSGMKLPELELLYARLTKIVVTNETDVHRDRVLEKLSRVIGDVEQQAAAIPAENV